MHIVSAANDVNRDRTSVLTADVSSDPLSLLASGVERPAALSAPGPARVVTVTLSSGHPATIVHHERKHFIEIVATPEAGCEAGLGELLSQLAISPQSVTWVHEKLDRQALFAAMGAGGSSSEALQVAATLPEPFDGDATVVDVQQQDRLLQQRLRLLMKRHQAVSDRTRFEAMIAQDSLLAFSQWAEEIAGQYERKLRQENRRWRNVGWASMACNAFVFVAAVSHLPQAVMPLSAVAIALAVAQSALQARRSVEIQEVVDQFGVLRAELKSFREVRKIDPLDTRQWSRLQRALAKIEE